MITVILSYKRHIVIDPDKIDIIKSSHKYSEIYTEGKMYLHYDPIKMIMKEYGEKFIQISRGLIINKNFIAQIRGTGQHYRVVIPTKDIPSYPNYLPVSRRQLGPVIQQLKDLNKVPETVRPCHRKIVVS